VRLKQIHIKLAETLHRDLRIQAAIKGQSLQAYVIHAIQNQLDADQSAYRFMPSQTQEATDDHNTQ
jgi:plasmid stability protein